MNESFVSWSEGIRASDRTAFTKVFEAMHPQLLRYAWRLTDNKDSAQDIVQDAFLKLWHKRETLDSSRSLKALLYTIVRNLSLNASRQELAHKAESDQEVLDKIPMVDDADVVSTEDLSVRLQTAINSLPPRRKEAFMLSRFSGLSHEEIAKIMGLTARTVNTHIVLTLKHLRHYLRVLDTTTLDS